MNRSLIAVAAVFTATFGPITVSFAQEKSPPVATPKDSKGAKKPANTKPQSELAAKGATFRTVPATDTKVKTALAATDLAGAKKAVGKTGAFVGTVADVYISRGNGVTKLNFDADFHKAFTAVIFPNTYAKLPDVKTLKGKKLLVTGKIEEYKGDYEIVVKDLDQIKTVK